MKSDSQTIIDAFHTLWYNSDGWWKNTFMGYPIYQSPSDMMVYHDIIMKTLPRLVVQTGVEHGGSLFWLTHLLGIVSLSDTPVIGIDTHVTEGARRVAGIFPGQITLIEGDSASPETLKQVMSIAERRTGLVSLDSDHSAAHVMAELKAYHTLVGCGDYLVVEDTNLGGHPVRADLSPGPYEAVSEWLPAHPEFEQSLPWQHHLFTQHTWLQKGTT